MWKNHKMHEMRVCAILVLGMHRSGTSGLTGSLGILGCGLPASPIPQSPDNPKGFFESRPVAYFNEDLLKSAGLTWQDWQPVPPEWFTGEAAAGFLELSKTLLQGEFGGSEIFVMKDPRMCRLFPYWQRIMQISGTDLVVIHAHRHPMEVAQSLLVRDGLPLAQGLLLWIGHILQAEKDSRGSRRSFNRFDDLLDNPVETLRLIQNRLGIRFPHPPERKRQELAEFLSADQRHHQIDTTDELPDMIRKVYDILNRWAKLGESASDYATLDRIHECLHEGIRDTSDPETVLLALRWIGAEHPPELEEVEVLEREGLTALTSVLVRTCRHLDRVLQDKDATLNKLAAAMDECKEALAKSTRQIEEEAYIRQQLETRNNILQKQMTRMRSTAELTVAQNRVASCEYEIEALRQHLTMIKHERDTLLNSTTWRVTAPLRKLLGALSLGKSAGQDPSRKT